MKKIIIALIMCASLFLMAGCTITTTTTTVDSKGSTVTKKEEVSNGKKTTSYEDVSFSISNRTGLDIAELYLRMSDSTDWGNSQIPDADEYFCDGDKISGYKTSFSLDQPKIDIKIIDEDEKEITISGIDLSVTQGNSFNLAIEYDSTNNKFGVAIEY